MSAVTSPLEIHVLLLLLASFISCHHVDIVMPDVQPTKKESYLCTYKELPTDGTYYAYKFKPLADQNTAHHMLVFACSKPKKFLEYWDCTDSAPCRGEEQIIYAWAKNAPELDLPKHVGVALGDSSTRYIITQIHYARPLKEFETDSSGVKIYLSYATPKYISSIYLFSSNQFEIPAKKLGYHVDIACRYHGATIKPFAFRTHAHSHGRSISAYRIRDGKWHLIGIGDPQKPQAFYNVKKSNRKLIKDGDVVAARCTYDSLDSSKAIQVGAFSHNEMCNFYMMYYTMNIDDDDDGEEVSFGCSHTTHHLHFPKDSELPYVNVKSMTSLKTLIPLNNTTALPTKSSTKTSPLKSKWTTTKTHPATTVAATLLKNKTVTHAHHNTPVKQYTPVLNKEWSMKDDIKIRLGEITSIEMTNDDDLLVLHRSDRKLKLNSFDEEHVFVGYNKPISQDTVFKVNTRDGSLVQSFGKNLFYFPSSMCVDQNGMYWITDLALHQVFQFSPNKLTMPVLTLGMHGKPGTDMHHFCGPYDVIVDGENNIFVADGLCNSRILKFNSKGEAVLTIGNNGILQSPRSLSIDTKNSHLYVYGQSADIIHVFNSKNGLHVTQFKIAHGLSAITFSHLNGGMLFLSDENGSGHVISAADGDSLLRWDAVQGSGSSSGAVISKDNSKLFIAQNHPLLVSKFNIYKSKSVDFPWVELRRQPTPNTTLSNEKGDIEQLHWRINQSGITESNVTVVPAVIVVVVLATPIVLVLIALLMQSMRKRRKVEKAAQKRQLPMNSAAKHGLCGGCCCITRKYYYDSNRDFDKLVKGSTDDSTDDEEEDLFTRKA